MALSRPNSDRKREIQQTLVEMNVGCLLVAWILLGLPFLALGSFSLYSGIREAIDQVRLNTHALEVPAQILSSRVVEPVGARSDSSSFYAEIEFTYHYEQEVYRSHRVWPLAERSKRETIQSVVDRFPIEAQVTAYLDPENPEFAFLEKRWSPLVYISVSIGLFTISFLVSVGLLLVGWRRPRLALFIALVVSGVLVGVSAMALSHSRSSLPGEVYPNWLPWILGFSLVGSFAPLASMLKVRTLNRLFLSAKTQESPIP